VNPWRVLALVSLSFGFVFVAHTLPSQADTVILTGAAGFNGANGVNPGDSGTDAGSGGAATAIAWQANGRSSPPYRRSIRLRRRVRLIEGVLNARAAISSARQFALLA
jgi:hypothetical protein